MDGKVNSEGRKLISFMEERGWCLYNGNMKGDEKGEYTFIGGKGCTVIDYIMGEEETKGKVKWLRVENKVDSDHHPIEAGIRGIGDRKRGERRQRRQGRRCMGQRREKRIRREDGKGGNGGRL